MNKFKKNVFTFAEAVGCARTGRREATLRGSHSAKHFLGSTRCNCEQREASAVSEQAAHRAAQRANQVSGFSGSEYLFLFSARFWTMHINFTEFFKTIFSYYDILLLYSIFVVRSNWNQVYKESN